MYLGRVVGCVWSTVKHKDLEGQRLLIVQPLTPELKKTGRRIVCADWTGAGAGELIYWCRGKESSFPFLPVEVPTDTTIVGIVDELHVKRPAVPAAAPSDIAPSATAPPDTAPSDTAPPAGAPAAPAPSAAARPAAPKPRKAKRGC